jgi:hypothetical protein
MNATATASVAALLGSASGGLEALAVPKRVGSQREVLDSPDDFVAVLLVQCLGLKVVGEVDCLGASPPRCFELGGGDESSR